MKADVRNEVLKAVSFNLVTKEQLERELVDLKEIQLLTTENLGYGSPEIAEEIRIREELLEEINN